MSPLLLKRMATALDTPPLDLLLRIGVASDHAERSGWSRRVWIRSGYTQFWRESECFPGEGVGVSPLLLERMAIALDAPPLELLLRIGVASDYAEQSEWSRRVWIRLGYKQFWCESECFLCDVAHEIDAANHACSVD